MKKVLAGASLAAALFLAGCPTTIEGAFGRARQTQAVAEQKVDTIVRELLTFTCDLDVKRLNLLSGTEAGFGAFFWERCGAKFPNVIDGAILYRNANPAPKPTAGPRALTVKPTAAGNHGPLLAAVAPREQLAPPTYVAASE